MRNPRYPWQQVFVTASYLISAILLLVYASCAVTVNRTELSCSPSFVITRAVTAVGLLAVGAGLLRRCRITRWVAVAWPLLPIGYGGYYYLRCLYAVAVDNVQVFIPVVLVILRGIMLFGLLFLPASILLLLPSSRCWYRDHPGSGHRSAHAGNTHQPSAV